MDAGPAVNGREPTRPGPAGRKPNRSRRGRAAAAAGGEGKERGHGGPASQEGVARGARGGRGGRGGLGGRGGRGARGGRGDGPATADTNSEDPLTAMATEARRGVLDANEDLMKEVENKLRDGVYSLQPKAGGVRSIVWKQFLCVYENGNEIGVARCKLCKKKYKYGEGNGSSMMLKHAKKCKGESGSRPYPPPHAKDRAKSATVRWTTEAMKPQNAVEHPAFIDLMQSAIDIGHSCGPVDASQLLPKRTCVREAIVKTADEVREGKLPGLRKAMREGACGACTDLWVEKYSRTHYLAVTVSYIVSEGDRPWSIETMYLFMVKFDEEASGDCIREAMVKRLLELNITEEEFRGVVFVSDNGSNVKKALEGWARNYCMGHALNIVVRSGIELKYHELLSVAIRSSLEIEKRIEACDDVVRKIKSIPKKTLNKTYHQLQKNLRASKRQHNSYWMMLESVRNDFSKVRECVADVDIQVESFDSVTESWLDEVLELLAPFDFDGCREKGSAVSTKQWPSLLEHCIVKDEDASCVIAKEALKAELGVLQVMKLVEECKQLVTFLRTSGLDQNIPNLKQEIEVRWNTHVDMLLSVDNNWMMIREVLCAAGKLEKIDGINRDCVQLLVKFWSPFKKESDKLEGEGYRTLPLACLSMGTLRRHVQKPLQTIRWSDDGSESEEEEEEDFRRLRLKTARLLETIPIIDMYHKVAHFLHPRYRELRIFDLAEREEVFEAVRKWIQAQEPESLGEAPSPPKRSRLEEEYSEYDDEWTSGRRSRTAIPLADEVLRYVSEVQSIPTLETLLDWWRTEGSAFPKLQEIAKRVLAVPATSAPCERLFSNAGNIINVRRTCLKPDVVDAHVFLHKHYIAERRSLILEQESVRKEQEREEKQKEIERQRKCMAENLNDIEVRDFEFDNLVENNV